MNNLAIELRRFYLRPALLYKPTIQEIGKRQEIDTIGFVIGEQQFERLRIPTMSPPPPHPYRVPTIHTLQCTFAFDADPAFNLF